MKTAIYCRVSTARQAEEGFSLDAQETRCKKYADSQDWEVVEVYRDEGVSGRTMDRPALARLLANAKDYDRVVTFKMSRLGRSARDVLNVIGDFQANGCQVVFLEDGLDTGKAANRLVITILAGVAEMESENIAEQVRLGMEASAKEGNWLGGPVPFGLVDIDGSLELDPIPVEALRLATQLILSGRSTRDAADALNGQDYRPPRSPSWKSQELRRHLRSEHLSGVHRWADISREVPAVMERETWERLQKVLDETSLQRGHKDLWTLSQRLTCTCGATFVGQGRRHGNSRIKKQRYYRCGAHRGDQKGECQCDHDDWPDRPRWWDASDLEKAAWQELIWTLRNRDLLDAAMDAHLGESGGGFDEDTLNRVTEIVERLRRGLISAKADLYEAEDRTIHEAAIQTLQDRFDAAVREQERLEALRADQSRADQLRRSWIEVAEGLATFQGADVPSPEEQKAIYQRLNVRFVIAGPRQDRGDVEVFVPFSSWIQVEGADLPSYNDSAVVRPCP